MTDTELPDGWRWVRLGEVCERMRNGTTAGQNSDSKGLPVTRIETISTGIINLQKVGWLDLETGRLQEYVLCPGDILFSHINSVERLGNCALYDGRPAVLIHGMNLLRFEPRRDMVEPVFLLSYLRSGEARRFFSTRARRAIGQASLNTKDLQELAIPLPPLPEQKRIAAILADRMAAIDRARAATEAQLEASRTLPAAYLRAVFDSPEAQEWPRKRIGDFANTCSGTTPSRDRADYYGGSVPWVKTGELRDGVIDDTGEHVSEVALRETSLRLLPAETLLVAMYGQGQTRGRTGLLARPATTNQACFAVLPQPDQFDTTYLQLWFRCSYWRLRRETEGRGGNQPNLNGDVLRDQLVPFPTLVEQHNIALVLSRRMASADRLRTALSEQLEMINKLPAALLRQAFNGEL